MKNSKEKELDPYEDEILLHYLKENKFLPGSSKKQCKRAQNKPKHLIWADNTLYYHDDPEDQKLLRKIPKKEERMKLIKEIHAFGHFGFEKTYKEACERYYWKNMDKDCEFIIKSCLPCLRFKKTPVLDHPALALPINQIMDRIGVDLVFGFPKTADGYVGVMVITEYLTKYPYAVPIKTKSATEIGAELFKFISIFGPPKEILSDQGKEF